MRELSNFSLFVLRVFSQILCWFFVLVAGSLLMRKLFGVRVIKLRLFIAFRAEAQYPVWLFGKVQPASAESARASHLAAAHQHALCRLLLDKLKTRPLLEGFPDS